MLYVQISQKHFFSVKKTFSGFTIRSAFQIFSLPHKAVNIVL